MKTNKVDTHADSLIACIFTMMLPGLGQMMKSKIIPGIIWSVGVGGGYLINGYLGLAIHLLCILDAAFIGGSANLASVPGWIRKGTFTVSLIGLLIYTCLRTALF